MAGSSGFSISITAVDKTAGALDNINKRLARLGAPAERFNRALNKFGDVSGVSRAAEAFRSLSRGAEDAFLSIDRSSSAMSSLTSAASLAGLAALATRFADLGAATGRTAHLLDIPVVRYSALTGAAKRYGASVDAVRSSLNAIHEEIYSAVYNKDQASIANLAMLHINPGTKENPANDLDVLKQIADRVAATKDVHGRENILDMNHIDRAMLPLMEKGSKGIEDAMARTQFLGGAITSEMVRNATRMQAALADLSTAFGGIANRLGNRLDALMAGPVERFDSWLGNHKPEADKAAVGVGAGGAALGLRMGRPLLSMVGMGGLSDIALPLLGSGAAAWSMYRSGQDLATGQDLAAKSGFTQVAGIDASGMPTAYLNPKTGATKSAMEFDPRYNPALRGSPSVTTPGAPRVMDDPIMRGFLNTIAGPESGGLYDIKNGGSRFSGYGSFPEGIGPGGTSTAAGRYQFLSSTWHDEQDRLSLTDFGPDNQDAAAWDLANRTYRDKTGRDLLGDLKAGGNDMRIASGLNDIWPSLPGGSQSRESLSEFHDALARNTGGEVNVNVRFQNAPPGMRADVQTSGNVKAPPPGVGTTLPFAH